MITDYNRLPLGKYLEICQVLKEDAFEDVDKQVKIISILSDIPEEEVLHLPIAEYRELALQSAFLSGEDKNRHQAARKYNLGKWVLIPTYDYRKIETAQYIDFQTFAPLYETKMAELLSCLLVPQGKRYNEGYDILEVQQVLREELSVTDAISLSAFFLRKYKKLIVDMLNYCKEEISRIPGTMMLKKRTELQERVSSLERLLQTNGVGLRM